MRSASPSAPSGLVENADRSAHLAADGLRTTYEPEQLAAFEWASVPDLGGRQAAAARPAAGHDRARGGRAAGLERDAPLLPPDAHRRAAGTAGDAQPVRPAHGRRVIAFTAAFGIWGALDLPRRLVVVEEASRAAGRDRGLRGAAGRALLRGDRRVVRGARVGVDGRRAPGDHRPSVWATRSSASSSTRGTCSHLDEWVASPVWRRLDGRAAHQAWRCRWTSSRRPARSGSRRNIEDGIALADEDAARASSRSAIPGMWARIAARRRFMRDALGITTPPGRAAALQHPGVPAAVPVAAGPRPDASAASIVTHPCASACRSRSAIDTWPLPCGNALVEATAEDAVQRRRAHVPVQDEASCGLGATSIVAAQPAMFRHGASIAQDDEIIIGVSWNNYNEERWLNSDEPAMKAAIEAAGGDVRAHRRQVVRRAAAQRHRPADHAGCGRAGHPGPGPGRDPAGRRARRRRRASRSSPMTASSRTRTSCT